ncbi:hypothetical protein [Thioclava sp.]|uniref:hypothetical protein n=1 Tax=Thioclava sp. TaxID=1933450 RepID=UPI003AA8D9BD
MAASAGMAASFSLEIRLITEADLPLLSSRGHLFKQPIDVPDLIRRRIDVAQENELDVAKSFGQTTARRHRQPMQA